MKADPSAQRRLLDLQALDTRLQQLAHKRRSLPEHAEIDSLTNDHTQLRDLLVAAQTEESDRARDSRPRPSATWTRCASAPARDQQRLDSGAGSPSRGPGDPPARDRPPRPSARATSRTPSWS